MSSVLLLFGSEALTIPTAAEEEEWSAGMNSQEAVFMSGPSSRPAKERINDSPALQVSDRREL